MPLLTAKNLPNIGKKGEKLGKIGKKEEKSGRNCKNQKGSFTLPLLIGTIIGLATLLHAGPIENFMTPVFFFHDPPPYIWDHSPPSEENHIPLNSQACTRLICARPGICNWLKCTGLSDSFCCTLQTPKCMAVFCSDVTSHKYSTYLSQLEYIDYPFSGVVALIN